MTAVDVDALDAARAAASKVPWGLVGGTHDRIVIDDHGCHVATTGTFPDAALIVAAVNALPDLLAEVRRGRALREAVEGLADQYRAVADGTYNVAAGDAYDEVVLDLRAALTAAVAS